MNDASLKEDKGQDMASDQLMLELHKEEEKVEKPTSFKRGVLILFAIFAGTAVLAVGIGLIFNYASPNQNRPLSEWIAMFFMLFGSLGLIIGGILGFWGGQRKIPIRLVSPSDSSIVGKEAIVCGYVIEDCLDNEIELTLYKKDGEIFYENLLPINDQGIFYLKMDEEIPFPDKTSHMKIETWMVAKEATELKFLKRNLDLENMNVASRGIRLADWQLFPRIYKDFADKINVIVDPSRKEKGLIEKVSADEYSASKIFFPKKDVVDEKFVPFSMDRVAKMRENACNFDRKRRNRFFYSLIIMGFSLLLFVFPAITAIIEVL
jgi:hypothetical protein